MYDRRTNGFLATLVALVMVSLLAPRVAHALTVERVPAGVQPFFICTWCGSHPELVGGQLDAAPDVTWLMSPAYQLRAHWVWHSLDRSSGDGVGTESAPRPGLLGPSYTRCDGSVRDVRELGDLESANPTLGSTHVVRRCSSAGRIVIAVIDNGFDLESPALRNQVVGAYECGSSVTSPNAALRQPYRGTCEPRAPRSGYGWTRTAYHGDRIASIAAGDGPHGTRHAGFRGVAPHARLLLIRRVDPSSDWRYTAAAIRFAVDSGADVITMGFGKAAIPDTAACFGIAPPCRAPMRSYTDSDFPMVADALRYATDQGVIAVCASGNTASSTSRMMYPATSDGCMSVGKTDIVAGSLAPERRFGSHTRNAEGPQKDFVGAPGWSLQAEGGSSGSVTPCAGTSCATPAIAGSVALLMANGAPRPNASDPDVEHTAIYDALRRSALDIGTPGRDPEFGWGLPDLGAALDIRNAPTTELPDCTPQTRGHLCAPSAPTPIGPLRPLRCADLALTVGIGTSVNVAERRCAALGVAWTHGSPDIGEMRDGVYRATASRVGATSFELAGNGWRQLVRIRILPLRVRAGRPIVRCARAVHRAARRCTVRGSVSSPVARGALRLVIERRVVDRRRTRWSLVARCPTQQRSATIVCTRVLRSSATYRTRVIVAASPARDAVVSTPITFRM